MTVWPSAAQMMGKREKGKVKSEKRKEKKGKEV